MKIEKSCAACRQLTQSRPQRLPRKSCGDLPRGPLPPAAAGRGGAALARHYESAAINKQQRRRPRLGPGQLEGIPLPPLTDSHHERITTSARREWMKLGMLGAAGLAAANAGIAAPVVTKPAKAVIQIWMWGGPSHLDTFDPKPAGRPRLLRPLRTNRSPPTSPASGSASCCRCSRSRRTSTRSSAA